ncbi:hypothetical protein ABMA57_01935 [Saccharospirillum sp. HFRX-1]|uniref:hypothetical protein n=1 Tax=unclassified Saccharospirillum TaxID=2633430 RepID=UPI003713814A
MTQQSNAQTDAILSVVKEIKTMVMAERREAEFEQIHDELNAIGRQHESIRNDLREVLMKLAQNQTAAD